MILFKWIFNKISHEIMRILLRAMNPVLYLFSQITLLLMVLTWTSIQNPINITPILGICKTNCTILLMDTELMGGLQHTREGDDPQNLKVFPKK